MTQDYTTPTKPVPPVGGAVSHRGYCLLLLLALFTLLAPRGAGAQVLRNTFAGGINHSLAIRADGSLWATGLNSSGQLGTGTNTSSSTWVRVGTDTDWVQVSVGTVHSLGLKANGTAWAWGNNADGQLGTTATTSRNVPTLVSGGFLYNQVAAGGSHSLGLRPDGLAVAWGRNDNGQLGNNSSANSPVPVVVDGGLLYTQLAAGANHSLGLRADGTAWAWGFNSSGQLGTTDNLNRAVPTAVTGGLVFSQLSAGTNHSLGLRSDGTAYAWGNGFNGQLGNAGNANTSAPGLVNGGNTYTQVAAGTNFSLGLRSDGTAYAWGSNGSGRLGDGTATAQQLEPVAVSAGNPYAQLAAGGSHGLGLRANGTLWAWGSNANGQLGNGIAPDATAYPTPQATGSALPTRGAAAGTAFGLAVRADGTLWAWGSNGEGQLGLGTAAVGTNQPRPMQVGTDKDWVQVAAGFAHTVALKADGTAWAWGRNDNGQLGTNDLANRAVPTAVAGGLLYTQVAAGGNHSLGLRDNGTAYAWGINANGRLGNGNTADRSVPTAVSGGFLYTQLAAGRGHSLGLRDNGAAYGWGFNSSGQVGNNTVTQQLTPALVLGGFLYTQLAGGGFSSLGVRAAGLAVAWGLNNKGQLGNGNTTNSSVPVLVNNGVVFSQLAGGDSHSAGLQPDGTLWAWGLNANGQLGDGSTTDQLLPTREATQRTDWATLPAGAAAFHTLARTASGLAFASTGLNTNGQLGDRTFDNASRFDRLSPLNSFQPLPVALVDFAARRTGPAAVALAWNTAAEKANAGFGVEKSSDGVVFTPLGFVPGAGSSTTPRAYTYMDANARTAAYYRLAQTDANGTVTHSTARFVPGVGGAETSAAALVLVPNPAHGGTVQVPGLAPGELLRLYDGLGRLVRPAAAGLDVAGLPAGVYLVRAGVRAARLVVE